MSREHSYAEISVIHNHPYAEDETVELTRQNVYRQLGLVFDSLLDDLEEAVQLNPPGLSPARLVWNVVKAMWRTPRQYRRLGLPVPWRKIGRILVLALNYRPTDLP
jgi:hypothetical protein